MQKHLYDSYQWQYTSSGILSDYNRRRWLARYNPGVQDRQPGFGKSEKTEFTVAGILRDAELHRQGDRQTIQ
jgi:hypothetical protein